MILVDTSIWIDHLHASEPMLMDYLDDDRAGSHPAVIEELALGAIKARDTILNLLADLWRFPKVSHDEVLELVDQRRLWGRELSAVDARLLGSVALVPGARLWTRDKRLIAACQEHGIGWIKG